MSYSYYRHLTLLVISLEFFYSEKIEKKKLNSVQNLLRKFLSQINNLYDNYIIKSGFHELLHLSELTESFGPINGCNCYQFEEINRKITGFMYKI